MTRPARVVVVAGTGTGVGKTWVAARLSGLLADRGLRVAARKPVQSYAPDELGRTDAELLAAVTHVTPTTVCPVHRWDPVPFAPPMAAAAQGKEPFVIDTLAAELVASWSAPPADIGVVELAGGPRSPIAADGDCVALIATIRPDVVVLVADAGLGTINAVTLSIDALTGWPLIVLLNRFDPHEELHRRNQAWLADRLTCPVVTTLDALRDLVY
jgi:dethiobiotin synthetase